MKMNMSPLHKLWYVLEKIHEASLLAPSGGSVKVERKPLLERGLSDNEINQILKKLGDEHGLLRLEEGASAMNGYIYKLSLESSEKFLDFADEIHTQIKGSIETLSPENFFSVVDVTKDIDEKLEVETSNDVTIPVIKQVIRFPILCPGGDPGSIEHYGNYRVRAIRYLKERGHILDYRINRGIISIDATISVKLRRMVFQQFYSELVTVYQSRVLPSEKEDSKAIADTGGIGGDSNPYQVWIDVIDLLMCKIEVSSEPKEIKLHICETHLPQNSGGCNDLRQFLASLSSQKIIQEYISSGGSFNVIGLNKERLIEKRNGFVNVLASSRKQDEPLKIEIINKELNVKGIEGIDKNLEKMISRDISNTKLKFPYKILAGTKWEHVSIIFLDENTVKITVKGKQHTATFLELQLIGKGSPPPPSEVWIFLKVLAQLKGEITIIDAEAKDTYKKQKQLLTEFLQSYFSIDYDPFYPYNDCKSYKAKFDVFFNEVVSSKAPVDPCDDVIEDDLGVREYLSSYAPSNVIEDENIQDQ